MVGAPGHRWQPGALVCAAGCRAAAGWAHGHCCAHGDSRSVTEKRAQGYHSKTGPPSLCLMGLQQIGCSRHLPAACFQLLWPDCTSNSPNPDWLPLGICHATSSPHTHTHTRLLAAKAVILVTQIIVQVSLCPSLDVVSEHRN